MVRLTSNLLLLITALVALPSCVSNRGTPAEGPLPRDVIVVVGQGEVMGKPDVARLQLGVEARASDAATAVNAINAKAGKMIAVLKQLGIRPEDLQTRDFNIHSERLEDEPMPFEEPSAPVNAPRPSGLPPPAHKATAVAASEAVAEEPRPLPRKRAAWRFVFNASNTVHVTVRDLSRLGEVLSRAVDAGANRAWGISFEIDDDAPLVEKARAEAVADARAQAAELAKHAGVRLGSVVSIVDGAGGGSGPMPPMAGGFAMMEMKAVPTESGQLAVQHHVQVVFAIERTK
jgi:uncharacterized protein YggE